MSLAQALSSYVNLNLMIILAFLALTIFKLALKATNKQIDSQRELKLHYTVLATIITLTALSPLIPQQEFFEPPARVWSGPSLKHFDIADADRGGYLTVPTPKGMTTVKADQVANIWMVIAAVILSLGGLTLTKDLRRLLKTKRESYLVRRHQRVRIWINDQIHVPFSYWLPMQANIVLPSQLLSKPQDYQMAIAHELQHHRHGDTRWVYLMWGLKLVCIVNPAIHLWNRWISELQEFACDETLVDQNKVESQAYARCLVEVAQTAGNHEHVPVCATGLTFLVERNLLKRRIEKMFTQTQTKIGRSISQSVAVAIATLMCATALAAKGLIQDRRVTMSQAANMALRAQSQSDFPVVVNDLVLKHLNRFIGTPQGRDSMREALVRMEAHKAFIDGVIAKYGAPPELLAIPLIESGYKNLPQTYNKTANAAGFWQFIPQTAKNFGLFVHPDPSQRVDAKRDERLDIPKSTDAAIRYLSANYLRFTDWHLAVMAYNIGENTLEKGIRELGTRDGWVLTRNGYQGDGEYLAKLTAAIMIMRNPESVE